MWANQKFTVSSVLKIYITTGPVSGVCRVVYTTKWDEIKCCVEGIFIGWVDIILGLSFSPFNRWEKGNQLVIYLHLW